ncbi:hypothetical protein A0J61_00218 [Choanephora cucurbitarum]|uniref:Uncharacterized protein n=1 Tax=Choanephora cucurbitarum TaxID=101091 RepID=A0A1C7NWH3_9FUNG|nr:hypothetical protein A0J61_00218 [Choanephora cucurbitarum]
MSLLRRQPILKQAVAQPYHQAISKQQRRPLSMWTIPKIILATTSKRNRGVILGTLGAASYLSSVMGPAVWVAAGGAASLFSWRLFRKTQKWWNYLSPILKSSDSQTEPSFSQAILSQIGTHRAAEVVRVEAIKSLKQYFSNSSRGKELLEQFGLDHPADLVWQDIHKSETERLEGNQHRVSSHFWLEDQTSSGPRGGSCEVTATAIVSGEGNIKLEQVKLSSPGWHQDEIIDL